MSLTLKEQFHLHGFLPARDIENLIDLSAQVEESRDVTCHLDEARAQYPKEDFLQEVLKDMQALHTRMRGDTRMQLWYVIGKLDELRCEVIASAEYGRDELKKATAVLDDLELVQ